MSTDSVVTLLMSAFLVALVAIRGLGVFARRRDLLDHPNWRSSHTTPTPRLGGLGILIALWVGVVVGGQPDGGDGLVILAAATALALTGLADDIWSLSPGIRLACEGAAALALMVVLQPDVTIALPGTTIAMTGVIAGVVGVVWLVGVVNILNFMDGLDGLAGGTAVVASIALLALGAPVALMLAIAGACLGFLVWNHAPAYIFMGDGGSMMLGLLLGSAMFGGAVPVPIVAVALVLAPLLLDASFTLAVRLKDRKPIFSAHHEHLYQRLSTLGVESRVVASGYWAAAGVCGLLAIRYESAETPGRLAILLFVVASFAVYVGLVRRLERMTPANPRTTASQAQDHDLD